MQAIKLHNYFSRLSETKAVRVTIYNEDLDMISKIASEKDIKVELLLQMWINDGLVKNLENKRAISINSRYKNSGVH